MAGGWQRWGRVLLGIGATVGALLAAELALRGWYPALPSLAALAEEEGAVPFSWRGQRGLPGAGPDDCAGLARWAASRRARQARSAGTAPVGLEVVLVGDSVAAGAGVPWEHSVGPVLVEAIAARRGVGVALHGGGMGGVGYHESTHRGLDLVQRLPAVDLVVLLLFADDLERHAVQVVQGRLVADPASLGSPLARQLVGRSYLLNLAWLGLQARRGAEALRVLDPAGPARLAGHVADLRAAAEERGAGLVVALVAPTGLADCPAEPPADSRCRWLGADQDRIAAALQAAGEPFVDLRDLWLRHPGHGLPAEVQAVAEGRADLVVHPDEAGHALLAAELLPASLAALAEPAPRHGPIPERNDP